MWRRLSPVGLALVVALGVPGVAFGAGSPVAVTAPAVPSNNAAAQDQEQGSSPTLLNPPVLAARSWTQPPVIYFRDDPRHPFVFASDAQQAVAAAEATPQMQALHHREHPLTYVSDLWTGTGPHWEIYFAYRGTTVAEVDLNSAAAHPKVWLGALATAVDGRGHFGQMFDTPWVVLTFAALFLVPFLNPRRLLRMAHLDGLLLLSLFALPYGLFDHAYFTTSYLVLYPLLLLVLARMLWLGLHRDTGPDAHAPRWPLPMLAIGVLGLVAARVALDIIDPYVMDVGVASVIGAHAIAAGEPLYTNSVAHGDTYGPINYLAYLPFEALFPWRGVWNYVPAAHAAAIFFDVGTTAGLVVLGVRLRPGLAGRRLGLTLAWAWAAYPATLFGLMFNTNDGLIALLFVLGLLVYTSPVGRGATLGLAAAAKLFPVILLPLFAAGWRSRSWRATFVTVAIFGLVVVAAFAGFIPSGGVREIYDRTLGFQLGRSDPFSLWGLYPGLAWLKVAVEVGVCALAAFVFFLPPRQTLAQVAALAAALTVAVQLPAQHWFFFYLVWIAPLALVALLARGTAPAADRTPPRPLVGARLQPPPATPVATPAG